MRAREQPRDIVSSSTRQSREDFLEMQESLPTAGCRPRPLIRAPHRRSKCKNRCILYTPHSPLSTLPFLQITAAQTIVKAMSPFPNPGKNHKEPPFNQYEKNPPQSVKTYLTKRPPPKKQVLNTPVREVRGLVCSTNELLLVMFHTFLVFF